MERQRLKQSPCKTSRESTFHARTTKNQRLATRAEEIAYDDNPRDDENRAREDEQIRSR